MAKLTPKEMQKRTAAYIKNINKATKSYVAVGLPSEKIGGKIYGEGMTVAAIGAIHEYGGKKIPRRSFLNTPFIEKKEELKKTTEEQFADVWKRGKDADIALGLIGSVAVNISKGAFTTRGYGVWDDIKESTKKAKGSSQVLIDTGILRGSITYVVRSS